MSLTTVVADIKEGIEFLNELKTLSTEMKSALGLSADESLADAIADIKAAISGTTATDTTDAAAAVV